LSHPPSYYSQLSVILDEQEADAAEAAGPGGGKVSANSGMPGVGAPDFGAAGLGGLSSDGGDADAKVRCSAKQ